MIHKVKCRSGIVGWKARLQDNYDNSFESFQDYSEVYGVAERLGFESDEQAWEANPFIQGSANPKDLEVSPRQDLTDIHRDRSEFSYNGEYPR